MRDHAISNAKIQLIRGISQLLPPFWNRNLSDKSPSETWVIIYEQFPLRNELFISLKTDAWPSQQSEFSWEWKICQIAHMPPCVIIWPWELTLIFTEKIFLWWSKGIKRCATGDVWYKLNIAQNHQFPEHPVAGWGTNWALQETMERGLDNIVPKLCSSRRETRAKNLGKNFTNNYLGLAALLPPETPTVMAIWQIC